MRLARAVLLLTAVLLLGAAGPARAQTFVFGAEGEPVSFDPAIITDGVSQRVTTQVYDNLVRYKGATTDVEPALAEKWDVSADGKVWTLYIRKNVKFHDGEPLDAKAVVWNFERWWKASHPAAREPAEGRADVRVLGGTVRRLRRQVDRLQGGGGGLAHRSRHDEAAPSAVPVQSGDLQLRHCQPQGGGEVGHGVREAPGGDGGLQVRRMEGKPGGRAGGESRLLGSEGEGEAGGRAEYQGQLAAAGRPEGG